jgi:Glycosyltransferase family 87
MVTSRLLRFALLASLGGLAAFAVWNLVVDAAVFAGTSLQMDFSAVYTAGEALNHGLSPYRNHLTNDPPVWDGFARYVHSRFLYPPPVADAARVLAAAAPYRVAKSFWTFANLVFVGVSVWLAVRIARCRPPVSAALLLIAGCASFFPLRALLERGQFDALVLVLLMAAIHEIARGRRPVLAGILVALAIVVKPHAAYLVPFLFARRLWKVIAGVVAGGLGLAAISAASNGVGALSDYVSVELPRIAAWGEEGSAAMRLPESAIQAARRGLPPGWTSKDGVRYAVSALGFFPNATLVRAGFGRRLQEAGLPPAVVSAGILAALFGLFLAMERFVGATSLVPEPRDELAYWCAALVIVLLSAPLTWTMAVVWLLPAAVLLTAGRWDRETAWWRTGACLCAAGLIHAGWPDATSFLWIFGVGSSGEATYVQAELLVLAGLTAMLVGRRDAVER